MKRILALILSVLLFLFVFSLPAVAHSGRTDSSGGHYDSSSGEYHYHHGKPAHQHPNGECPYDSSGSSGSSGEILGLDYSTFFWCQVIYTVLFSLLTFKIGLGDMFCPEDKQNGCLPIVINIGIAIIAAFILQLIIRTFIV